MAARAAHGIARLQPDFVVSSAVHFDHRNAERANDHLLYPRTRQQAGIDQLIPLVYAELRRIAEARLRSERPGHTFQPTDLVHEVYARMAGGGPAQLCRSGPLYQGITARTMRKILIDRARARRRQARPRKSGGWLRSGVLGFPLQRPSAVIALDDALISLEKEDPLISDCDTLLGGLTAEESSVVVKLEVPEVRRELRQAQAWLRRELERAP